MVGEAVVKQDVLGHEMAGEEEEVVVEPSRVVLAVESGLLF